MTDNVNRKLARADASTGRVAEVMLRHPKTLPASASVGDVRTLFENSHVAMALLVDGTRFAGAIERDDLDDALPDAANALPHARRDVAATTADASVDDAMARLDASGRRRMVVLADDDTTLRGLLCLDRSRAGFCVD